MKCQIVAQRDVLDEEALAHTRRQDDRHIREGGPPWWCLTREHDVPHYDVSPAQQ